MIWYYYTKIGAEAHSVKLTVKKGDRVMPEILENKKLHKWFHVGLEILGISISLTCLNGINNHPMVDKL